MQNLVRPLRAAALAEAVSYLVLLGVAMPLKYAFGMRIATWIAGMVHGLLFLTVLWLLVRARMEASWPWPRVRLVFFASLVPIWPFFLDARVRQWIAETPVA